MITSDIRKAKHAKLTNALEAVQNSVVNSGVYTDAELRPPMPVYEADE